MKRVLLLLMVMVLLGACRGVPPKPQAVAVYDGSVGEEAYLSGNYTMADFYLSRALENARHQAVDLDTVRLWRRALANTYWEAGWDERLLTLAKANLPEADYHAWLCRVNEREGKSEAALKCYDELQDARRSDRVLREIIIKQTFEVPNATAQGGG